MLDEVLDAAVHAVAWYSPATRQERSMLGRGRRSAALT
jgi:hypothetical protein